MKVPRFNLKVEGVRFPSPGQSVNLPNIEDSYKSILLKKGYINSTRASSNKNKIKFFQQINSPSPFVQSSIMTPVFTMQPPVQLKKQLFGPKTSRSISMINLKLNGNLKIDF
jgi:hypothetical protein